MEGCTYTVYGSIRHNTVKYNIVKEVFEMIEYLNRAKRSRIERLERIGKKRKTTREKKRSCKRRLMQRLVVKNRIEKESRVLP
jgi:hypothetical protein